MDKIIVENCANCVFLHELHSDYFCKLSKKPITYKPIKRFSSTEHPWGTYIEMGEMPEWCELKKGVIRVGLKP